MKNEHLPPKSGGFCCYKKVRYYYRGWPRLAIAKLWVPPASERLCVDAQKGNEKCRTNHAQVIWIKKLIDDDYLGFALGRHIKRAFSLHSSEFEYVPGKFVKAAIKSAMRY